MTDTPQKKPLTLTEYYASKPAQQPTQETPQWVNNWLLNKLPKTDIMRQRLVWQQLRPGEPLPPELEVQQ